MDLTDLTDFLQRARNTLDNIQKKQVDNNCTAEDARLVQQLKEQLASPDIVKRIQKLLKRAAQRDPETKKLRFKPEFINAVNSAKEERDALYELSTNLFEDIKELDELAQEEEKKFKLKQQQWEKEEAERQEAIAIAEQRKRLEQERLEREERELDEKLKFEAAARKFKDIKDPVEKLYEEEKRRMHNIKPGYIALADALNLFKDTKTAQRKGSLRLLRDTFLLNIVNFPDKKEFFRINVHNPKFEKDVLGVKGCTEVLIAIGFKIVMEIEENDESETIQKNLYYILQEPAIEPGEMDLDKLDAWERWYKLQKLYLLILEQALRLSDAVYEIFCSKVRALSEEQIESLINIGSKEEMLDELTKLTMS